MPGYQGGQGTQGVENRLNIRFAQEATLVSIVQGAQGVQGVRGVQGVESGRSVARHAIGRDAQLDDFAFDFKSNRTRGPLGTGHFFSFPLFFVGGTNISILGSRSNLLNKYLTF